MCHDSQEKVPLRSSMSTAVFSARLMAGQEAIFFGYSLGLNGKCVANASDDREIKKADANKTCTERMTQGAGTTALLSELLRCFARR
jgi:hypothetical protein